MRPPGLRGRYGSAPVANESRLLLDENKLADERARKKFVKTFCSTQQLARRLASEFNEKLKRTRRVHPKTPRVAFLDCSIYELEDKKLGRLSVLVEEKLDHSKWQKWNCNNGFVQGMKAPPKYTQEGMVDIMSKGVTQDLGMIAEGTDEEESNDEDNEGFQIQFTAFEVAQAFSHFTFVTTGRKRLVCDLQGVFDEEANVLRFSDPVIHYSNPRSGRRGVHGLTDRGEKGIRIFFDTHYKHCGHLCKLMMRGFRRPTHQQGNVKKG